MPRQNRHFEPDTIYHVTDRGVDRRAVFRDDGDRRCFLTLILGALREAACSLLAYCLMGNHFHLLIGVSTKPLGRPMHRALTAYAARFNESVERSGHLFESRYYSRPVFDSTYLHNVVAYIHRNPVEAKMVDSVDEWAWSSHADWASLSGTTIDFARVQPLCGLTPAEVSQEYLRRIRFMAAPGAKQLSVLEIVRDTASMMGVDPEAILSGARGAVYTEARRTILRRSQAEGHPDVEVARALNCTKSAVAHLRERSS